MKPVKDDRIAIRLTADLKDRLRAQSKRFELHPSQLMRRYIVDGLEHDEKSEPVVEVT